MAFFRELWLAEETGHRAPPIYTVAVAMPNPAKGGLPTFQVRARARLSPFDRARGPGDEVH